MKAAGWISLVRSLSTGVTVDGRCSVHNEMDNNREEKWVLMAVGAS